MVCCRVSKASAYKGAIWSRSPGSVTTTNRQFWTFPPEGARMAVSSMESTTSSGMGSGLTRRIARVVYRASKSSMTPEPTASRRCRRSAPNDRLEPASRTLRFHHAAPRGKDHRPMPSEEQRPSNEKTRSGARVLVAFITGALVVAVIWAGLDFLEVSEDATDEATT